MKNPGMGEVKEHDAVNIIIIKMAQWDDEFKYGFTEVADSDYDPIRRILETIPIDQGMSRETGRDVSIDAFKKELVKSFERTHEM